MAMNTPPQVWLKRRPTRRSQGLMRCAIDAISSSVSVSITAKLPAINTNCSHRLRAGSMNCGKKAAKNRMPLGLVMADSAPWRNIDQPARGAALAARSTPIAGARQTWMPSHTR